MLSTQWSGILLLLLASVLSQRRMEVTHPAYIYALSDRIYDLVILLKFDAYSAKIRGDWQMSMNFIDLADKGMQLIEDVERQVVSPEQAKVLIEAHKNAR